MKTCFITWKADKTTIKNRDTLSYDCHKLQVAILIWVLPKKSKKYNEFKGDINSIRSKAVKYLWDLYK